MDTLHATTPADGLLLCELYRPCSRNSTCAHALLLAGSLKLWDLLARCCYFHVVGSLKLLLATTQQSVASASMHSEHGMFIAEHRSVVECCVCPVAELVCL